LEGVEVSASLTQSPVYVGQSSLCTVRIETQREFAPLSISRPQGSTFTTQELPVRSAHTAILPERPSTVRSQTFVLTPLMPGEATVQSLEIVIQQEVAPPKERREIIDPLFQTAIGGTPVYERHVLETPPLSFRVLPLPEAPPHFSGLVGHFFLHGDLRNSRVSASEQAELEIVVSGHGNFEQVRIGPWFDEIPGVDVFAHAPRDEIGHSLLGCSGRRVFPFTLVPRQSGRLEIPSVSLTVFDPDQAEFKTLMTRAMSLHVIESEPVGPVAGDETQAGGSQGVDVPRGVWFILAGGGLLTILAVAVLLVRHGRRRGLHRIWKQARLARAEVKTARRVQEDPTRCLEHMSRALALAAMVRAGDSIPALTWVEIEDRLRQEGANRDLARQVVTLGNTLDRWRFAPQEGPEQHNLQKMNQELRQAVQRLSSWRTFFSVLWRSQDGERRSRLSPEDHLFNHPRQLGQVEH